MTKEELQVMLDTGKGMFGSMSKDEPLAVIRASDVGAASILRHYCNTKKLITERKIELGYTAQAMDNWNRKEGNAAAHQEENPGNEPMDNTSEPAKTKEEAVHPEDKKEEGK